MNIHVTADPALTCHPDDIPVTFEHEGSTVYGCLSRVSGAGNTQMWHLTVNNYHWGELFKTERYGWRLSSNWQKIEHLAEDFGELVERKCGQSSSQ